MAVTLLDAARDLLRHCHYERKTLGPAPQYVRTPQEIDLAGRHFRLKTLEKDLAHFIDEWAHLTSGAAPIFVDPDEPTAEEIQTAIQSITEARP